MDADDRTFMHELLLRHEKATDAMIDRFNALTRTFEARSDEVTRQLRAGTEELRAHTRRMNAEHLDMIGELRAGREALFRMLDRLDEGGSAAGA